MYDRILRLQLASEADLGRVRFRGSAPRRCWSGGRGALASSGRHTSYRRCTSWSRLPWPTGAYRCGSGGSLCLPFCANGVVVVDATRGSIANGLVGRIPHILSNRWCRSFGRGFSPRCCGCSSFGAFCD